jgi:hypothetical protein
MRTDIPKCSNCGAALTSLVGSEGVHCAYCGTLNRVEAPTPGPAPAPPRPPVYRMPPPVIARPRRGASRLASTASLLAVCIGVAVVRFLQHGTSSLGSVGLPVVNVSSMTWEGVHSAIVADINGDHIPGLVGRVRYVLGGDRVAIAAFDGTSGTKLWETESLGTNEGVLGMAEDTLLFATGGGELRAYAAHNGKKAWAVSLPGKTAGF